MRSLPQITKQEAAPPTPIPWSRSRMLILTVQTFSSAEGLWLTANLVSQVHPRPVIQLPWTPQEGWLGAGRSWHLRVSPPQAGHRGYCSSQWCPPELVHQSMCASLWALC